MEISPRHLAVLARIDDDLGVVVYNACASQPGPFAELPLAAKLLMLDVNARDFAGNTPLHIAAFEGHGDVVSRLLAAGASVDKATTAGSTPLYIAAEKGHTAVAAALIHARADVNAAVDDGTTPLHWAAHWNDMATVELLLKAGADPNATATDGRPALMSVDDDRVALLLLRAGADPRVKYEGETLRQKARERRWPGTLAWLDAHDVP